MTSGRLSEVVSRLQRNWLWSFVHIAAWLPLVVWLYRYVGGSFAIDPVSQTMTLTGRLAIVFLLLSLSCTPLALLTGYERILVVRRPLGLYALLYSALHFLTFAGWDYRFDASLLRRAILDQPFVIIGFAAFVLLLALGMTSLRRLRIGMGRYWRWFQRLAYLAGVLVVLHVLWQVKSFWEAWRYPVVLAILFMFRLPPIRRGIVRARKAILRAIKERK